MNLDKTIEQYEVQILQLKSYLEKLPGEHIYAHKRKDKYIYCLRTRDAQGRLHEKYLASKQEKYIKACCENFYLRKLIFVIEKELHILQLFKRNYKPNEKFEVWDSLPEAYKQYVQQRFRDNKTVCHDWEYAEFESNNFPNTNANLYKTKKGEIVRSRIELIVADMLYDLGIPYRYECMLSLASGDVYPDFTIMHPETLELYYIEIFGMMDKPEYEQAAFTKIAKYAASDVYQNLLMFFDHKNAPISPSNIKKSLINMFK